MSNLETWKAAKAEYELYERAHRAAREVAIDAGRRRSEAWEALVHAARRLSPDEEKQAEEYQYGSLPPSDRGSNDLSKSATD